MKREGRLDFSALGLQAGALLKRYWKKEDVFVDLGVLIFNNFREFCRQISIYMLDERNSVMREKMMANSTYNRNGVDIVPLYHLPDKLCKKAKVTEGDVSGQYVVQLPLHTGVRLVGYIELLPYEVMDKAFLKGLKTMSAILSFSFEQYLLHRRMERFSRLFRETNHLSHELHSLLGSKKLEYKFVNLIVKRLGFDRVSLFIYEKSGRNVDYCIVATQGKSAYRIESERRLPVYNEPPSILESIPGFWIPMKIGQQIIGGLLVDNLYTLEPLQQDVLEILQELTSEVTLAIENSRLFNRIKERANTDDLTGLYRPGYFYDYLKKNLETQTKASIISIDIDHFKSINDTYGHPIGDKAIIEAAAGISNVMRPNDIACRMGGDEFIVYLKNTDSSQAFVIAERIVRYFRTRLLKMPGGQEIRLSISAGTAGYPEDAQDFQKLLSKADSALYLSKKKGKGCASMAKELVIAGDF